VYTVSSRTANIVRKDQVSKKNKNKKTTSVEHCLLSVCFLVSLSPPLSTAEHVFRSLIQGCACIVHTRGNSPGARLVLSGDILFQC